MARALYRKAGFTLTSEALGTDYSTAVARARELNQHLAAWREGRGAIKDLDLQPGFGSLGWLVERYKRSAAWGKVPTRSRPEYERTLNLVLNHKLTTGQGGSACSGAGNLGPRRGQVVRSASKERTCRPPATPSQPMHDRDGARMGRHAPLYPKSVPAENPFRGVELEHSKGTTRPATRAEAYAHHKALIVAGEPHLVAVPLVCFEWHQRPENVLAGHLSWGDYRPPERPNSVRVLHHKTGELAWLPLAHN